MIKNLLISLILAVTCLLAVPVSSLAYNSFNGVDCSQGNNSDSAVCQSKTTQDPVAGTNGALAKITNIVSYIAGALAVIFLVYGSIKYITSGGDSNGVKSAKDTVMFALIGIAVIVLARSIIFFVVNKL